MCLLSHELLHNFPSNLHDTEDRANSPFSDKYPAIICFQDIRIHRSDDKSRQRVQDAAHGAAGNKCEVEFSSRGGHQSHMGFELREKRGYSFEQRKGQPAVNIIGQWAGVCTLVHEKWAQHVHDSGNGQPRWDVQERFNFLQLEMREWNMAIINCFFPNVDTQAGTHRLAFTGLEVDQVEKTKAAGGDTWEHLYDDFYDQGEKDTTFKIVTCCYMLDIHGK